MAVVHKCDACKKAIVGERMTVDASSDFNRFEFCKKCAAPILAVLRKYKLTPSA